MIRSILFSVLVLFSAQAVYAKGANGAYVQQMQEKEKRDHYNRYTAEERAFLMAIAGKAASIVQSNLINALAQQKCILDFLKNPELCPQGRDFIFIIKTKYLEYRNAFVMSNYDKMMRDYVLSGSGGMGVAPSAFNLGSPFSRNLIKINVNELAKYKEQRRKDQESILHPKGDCQFKDEDKIKFYHNILSQVITTVPVILFINVIPGFPKDLFGQKRGDEVTTEDITNAYVDFVDNLRTTHKSFTHVTDEMIDGLFAYQLIAEQVIKANPERWVKVFESLNDKLTPDTVLEHFVVWFQNNWFNTFLIGCAVVSTAAGAPYVAAACTVGGALNNGKVLLDDMEVHYQYQREWVSGVRDWEAVESQRVKVQADIILLAIAAYSLKNLVPKEAFTKATQQSVAYYEALQGTSEEAVRKSVAGYVGDFTKEQGVDYLRGEFVALGMGYAYRGLLESQDINRVAQVSADILLQYKKTGVYTFSDRADILCRQPPKRVAGTN